MEIKLLERKKDGVRKEVIRQKMEDGTGIWGCDLQTGQLRG